MKNPVVMLFHNYSSFPVARATRVEIVDTKLMFDVQFVPGTKEYGQAGQLAQEAKALYKGGFMNTVSVGARALEFERPEDKDGPDRVYTRTELVELSLIPVPANPNALMVARGLESAVESGVVSVDGARTLMKALETTIGEIERRQEDEILCSDCGYELITLCEICDHDSEQDCECSECDDCKALDGEPSLYDRLLGIRSTTKDPDEEGDQTRRLITALETPSE